MERVKKLPILKIKFKNGQQNKNKNIIYLRYSFRD